MRRINLKHTDFEMWDSEIIPPLYDFFFKHRDVFRQMWIEQGKDFWTRFVITFRAFCTTHGAIKSMPVHGEKMDMFYDQAFIYIHEQFVDGKPNSAKNFVNDIVLLARNQHNLPNMEGKQPKSRDPFYMKETRDVFRRFFGTPDDKVSYLKVYILSPVFLRFGGSVCICLRRWFQAQEMDDASDGSYWSPPNDVNKVRLKVVEALCTDCFNEITESFFRERVHGKENGPRFIGEWKWGDPRNHDDLNPMYNPKADLKKDWRDGVNLRQFNHFYQYSKWTYGRDCTITICNCAEKKKYKRTDYTNIFAIDATEKVSSMHGGQCQPVEVVPSKPKKVKKKGEQTSGTGGGKSSESDNEDFVATKSRHLQQDGKSVSTHLKFEPKPAEPKYITQKEYEKMKKSGRLVDSSVLRDTDAKDIFHRLIADQSADKKNSLQREAKGAEEIEDTRVEKIVHLPKSFLLQAAVTGSKLNGKDDAVTGGYRVSHIVDNATGGSEIIVNTASLQGHGHSEPENISPADLPENRWTLTEEFLRRKFDYRLPIQFEWQEGRGWAAAVFNYTPEEGDSCKKPTNFRLRITCKEEQRLKWLMVHMIDYVVKRKKRKCPGWLLDEDDVLTSMIPDSAAIWEALCIRIQRGVNTESLISDHKPFVLSKEEKYNILCNYKNEEGSIPIAEEGTYQVLQDYENAKPVELSDLQKAVAEVNRVLKERKVNLKSLAWKDFYKAARENLPNALDGPKIWKVDTDFVTTNYVSMCAVAISKIVEESTQDGSETIGQYVDKYVNEVNEHTTKLICEYITGERTMCPNKAKSAEKVKSLRRHFTQLCLVLEERERDAEKRERTEKQMGTKSAEMPCKIHGTPSCLGNNPPADQPHHHHHHHHELPQRCLHCHKRIMPPSHTTVKVIATGENATVKATSNSSKVKVANNETERKALSNGTRLDIKHLIVPDANSAKVENQIPQTPTKEKITSLPGNSNLDNDGQKQTTTTDSTNSSPIFTFGATDGEDKKSQGVTIKLKITAVSESKPSAQNSAVSIGKSNVMPDEEFVKNALSTVLNGIDDISIKSVTRGKDATFRVKSTTRSEPIKSSNLASLDKPDLLQKASVSSGMKLPSPDKPDILKKADSTQSYIVEEDSSVKPDLLRLEKKMMTSKGVDSSKPDVLRKDDKMETSPTEGPDKPDILETNKMSSNPLKQEDSRTTDIRSEESPEKALSHDESLIDNDNFMKIFPGVSSGLDMSSVCGQNLCKANVRKDNLSSLWPINPVVTGEKSTDARDGGGTNGSNSQKDIGVEADGDKTERRGGKTTKKNSKKKTSATAWPEQNHFYPEKDPTTLLSAAENSNSKKKLKICAKCGKIEPSLKTFKKCQKCQAEELKNPRYYCGRVCQVDDWQERHKEEHKNNSLT